MILKSNGYKNSDIEKKILRTVDKTLHTHCMVQTADAVLVAVSGGPDSVALIHILCALAPKYAFRLAIGHLNHCLRQNESDRDQAFVATLAKRLELPIYLERQDVRRYQSRHRLSIEEAARQVRYRFFDAIAAKYGYDKIALGHQADDNAEVVLMNLLRGSGPLGISGIPPVRSNKIIRPLIHLHRVEIMNYLTAKKLSYVTDSSNRDSQFLRNKIRDQLIPILKSEYNPKLIELLNRLASILDSEEAWIKDLIRPLFRKAIVYEDKNQVGLSIAELNQNPVAVIRRLIREAILQVKGNPRRIAFAHVEAVLELVQTGAVSGNLDLPDRIRICREQDMLLVAKAEQDLRYRVGGSAIAPVSDYAYQLRNPGEIFIKEAAVRICFSEIRKDQVSHWHRAEPHIAFFDADKARFPLVIRNFRPGDRFSPLGISGSQKLKKFFIDHKITRIERAKCPIVLSRNKIIWVAGRRIDNAVKISPRTRRILKAELSLA